jgi:hypothetical protein
MTTITPEMTEAGVRAYRQADERFQSDEDIVAEIYGAMRLAVVSKVPHAGRNTHGLPISRRRLSGRGAQCTS